MKAFDTLRTAVAGYAKWDSDEIQEKVVNLLTVIEKTAENVGFDTEDDTDESIAELEKAIQSVDEETEGTVDKLRLAEGSEDDEEDDESSVFGFGVEDDV